VVGEVVAGGLLAQEHTSVHVEAEATHLPTEIEVSIDGVPIGTQVTAGDLVLPKGTSLVGDAEQVLLIVQEAPTAASIEAGIEGEPAAETPPAAVPASGEGATTSGENAG
jgi:large subunit ribosomal protein L25